MSRKKSDEDVSAAAENPAEDRAAVPAKRSEPEGAGAKQAYKVLQPLHHDGVQYEAGASVDLDRDQAAALKALGVV